MFGFAPLVWIGLKNVGGWSGMTAKLATAAELEGLVYSLTPKPVDDVKHWYQKPSVCALAVLAGTALLNVLFF